MSRAETILLKLAVEVELVQPNDVQAADPTLSHGAEATQDTYTLIWASTAKAWKLAERRPRLRQAMRKSLIRDDYETSREPDTAWDISTAQGPIGVGFAFGETVRSKRSG